jgi:hypothetical protein
MDSYTRNCINDIKNATEGGNVDEELEAIIDHIFSDGYETGANDAEVDAQKEVTE